MAKKTSVVRVTEFGIAVKVRLMEMQKTQTWLIEQVRERTGAYFDSSWLHRIMTVEGFCEKGYDGEPSKVEIIREILGMSEELGE